MSLGLVGFRSWTCQVQASRRLEESKFDFFMTYCRGVRAVTGYNGPCSGYLSGPCQGPNSKT